MEKENSVLTIDVGTDSLKMAEFAVNEAGGLVLKQFAFHKLDESASSEDGENELDFAHVYNKLLQEYHFTATNIRLTLPPTLAFLRLSKLPSVLGSRSAISKVVEFEACQTVPCSMDEVEWDYQLVRHAWVEKRAITQEDGSVSDVEEPQEEYEALFVAVKTEQITPYTDVIQDSGRTIVQVGIAPVALFNAAKATQVKEDECVLLINIGGKASSLVIADGNRVFVRSIPIAGDMITSQIAKEFGISHEDAEAQKRRYGFVALGGAYEEPESELAATISKIARNVMTRLHGEVSRSINVWRSQHGGNQPTRVLLAGGGSVMPYVTDFFQEKLRIPADYLNTFGAITIAPTIDKTELQNVAPMFQELIGSALPLVTQCPIDMTLLPRAIRDQRDLNVRKPAFYVSIAVLILCLGIFCIGVSRLTAFNANRVKRVSDEVRKTESRKKEVEALVSKKNGAKGEFEDAARFLKERSKWANMLSELQTLIPDTMWVTEIGAIIEKPAQQNDAMMPGLGGGGLFGGGAAASSKKDTAATQLSQQARFRAIADMTEVKGIHLKGYTLVLRGQTMQELEFKDKMKDSKFFSEANVLARTIRKMPNLTSFEINLMFKEPFRK